MKKTIKYIFKILAVVILVLLLVILLASLLIQTRPVKDRLTRMAEKQASGIINGNLYIGRLDGNFFTQLLLYDVLLETDSDTIAHISEIDLRYNLLSLFDGTLDFHDVSIKNPYIFLQQVNDSTWNLQQLVDPSEEPSDTTTSGTLNINLSAFVLSNGNIRIESNDTVIPQRIHDINADLSAYYSENKISAEIKNINLISSNPNLLLNQLSLEFEMDDEGAALENFIIKTAQNRIEGEGQFRSLPDRLGTAQFKTSPIQLDEFSPWLPAMQIYAKPTLSIEGSLEDDSVTVEINLEDNNQSIAATIHSGNAYEYVFIDTTSILRYHLETALTNINPGYWIGNPEMNYLLNGSINIRGMDIDPARADITMQVKLFETTIEDQKFSNIGADLVLRQGNLSGSVTGNGEFGDFSIVPRIQNLMDEPSYLLNFNANNLNLGVLTGTDSLASDINLQSTIQGYSFDPERMKAKAEVIVSASRFQDLYLDTLFTRVNYASENLVVDTLRLQAGTLTASATGNYSMRSASDLRMFVHFEDLDAIKSLLPVESLTTAGSLEARVSGVPDSLNFEAAMHLDSTQYDTISFGSIQLNATGALSTTDTVFNASAFVNNINLGSIYIDSVSAQVTGSPDSVFLQTSIANQDLNTELHAGVVPGEKIAITIPVWNITYKNQQFSMQQPPAYIELDSVNYLIDNFRLASNDSDSAQFISAQGNISRKGTEDFSFKAGNLNILQLTEMLDVNFNGTGLADIDLSLKGTAESPVLDGSFDVRNAELNEYKFTTLAGNMNLSDGILNFESRVVPQDSGSFNINASIPLSLNLDTMGFHFSADDSLTANISIDEFSLGVLNSFDIPVQTTGFIEGNVVVDGTANAPNPEGGIRLVDASFSMPEFGIDYRDVILNLDFLRDRIELDTLHIRTSDGRLTGNGLVNFGSDFYEGNISDSKIVINFDEFNPINHRQFNMQVDGYAELKGDADSVLFSGDLMIPQAEFYLPAIFRLMGRMDEKEMPKPLLVQELENMSLSLDSLGITQFEVEEQDTASFDYFENLRGQIRVRIPRNTWIKNDDMRLEISGEIDVIKEADFFELFGQVNVIRGQYELLGRVFIINEGTVDFQGGEELNFQMDIEAGYTFRNTRQVQQELTVNIKGTLEEPEIEFELDGNSIEEGDALSYILFGKSMDELTMNEQDNMERSGVGDLAQQAAASLISAQLTNFLQNKLNVDYIEVKSAGGFNEASVVVGKYLTNKLFVSYEQRFGQTDIQNPKKYEVKLEYELFRFLFFELNNSTIDSGFDVILKFDIM